MTELLQALDVLNARLCSAQSIGEAMDAAAGDSYPPWLSVYRDQVEAIRSAAEGLESLIRGIGGDAPDDGLKPPCPGSIRGLDLGSSGSDSRPA